MSKLDEILIKSIVTPTLPDTEYQKLRSNTSNTKEQIKALMAETFEKARDIGGRNEYDIAAAFDELVNAL